jgi:hypothetical protein
MALFSLIFNRPVKASFEVVRDVGGGDQKVVFELDASLKETHKRTAKVSQNPIEDGTNVADNVNLDPRGLELTGFVSDAPLSLLGSAVGLGLSSATQLASKALGTSAVGQAAAGLATTGLGSIAGIITGSPRDPKKAWQFLDEVWSRREPFSVVTALQRYENMVVASLSAPRESGRGKGLEFDITLEQVEIVQSSVIRVAVFKTGTLGGQSKAKLGKQSGKEAASNQSIAFRLLGFQKGGG